MRGGDVILAINDVTVGNVAAFDATLAAVRASGRPAALRSVVSWSIAPIEVPATVVARADGGGHRALTERNAASLAC